MFSCKQGHFQVKIIEAQVNWWSTFPSLISSLSSSSSSFDYTFSEWLNSNSSYASFNNNSSLTSTWAMKQLTRVNSPSLLLTIHRHYGLHFILHPSPSSSLSEHLTTQQIQVSLQTFPFVHTYSMFDLTCNFAFSTDYLAFSINIQFSSDCST